MDVIAVAVVGAYAVLGWFSGTIRRVIGLAGLFIAALVATNMGQYGGDILRQYSPTVSIPDARLIGWFFFLLLLVLAFEGAATAVHTQLQVSVVALNRGIGVALGLATAATALVAVTYMLVGYANAQTNQPTNAQVSARDQIVHSAFLLPMAKAIGSPILLLTNGALPRDSQTYFFLQETPR